MQTSQIAVVVGPVTDDVRTFEVPEMKVAALRFTRTARARILEVHPFLAGLTNQHKPHAGNTYETGEQAAGTGWFCNSAILLRMAVLSDSMHCLMVGALSALLHHEARQAQPPALIWLTCQ